MPESSYDEQGSAPVSSETDIELSDVSFDEHTTAPIISKDLQPWKNKDISDEDLLHDLMGCILKFWHQYGNGTDYSQAEAISDAYEGIRAAIKKDELAPNFKKKQKIKCEECGSIFKAPTKNIGDERANHLYKTCPYGRTPKYRNIMVTCTECGHQQLEKIYKSLFSTLVWYYIRSMIQRNFRKMYYKVRDNKVEVSLFNDDDNDLLNHAVAKEEEKHDELPESVSEALHLAMNKLVGKQRLVLALHHGLPGIYAKTTEREMNCEECKEQFSAVVDFNIAENNIECPCCGHDNKLDMRVPKTIKCHYCSDSFDTIIDYSKAKNYSDCPHCGTENTVDMRMNQTDIAKILSVSKQRVCSILRTSVNKLKDELGDTIKKYGII